MPRIAGRQKGTGNLPALQKIKMNRQRLEKMLLDKALAGDVVAIKACIELIDAQADSLGPTPSPSTA